MAINERTEKTRLSSRRDEKLLFFASRLADGAPLDLSSGGADNELTSEERASFALVDRVVQGFRHALNGNEAIFRFAGLDVLEKLGEGSYGEVYRAYDPMLRQEVALKLHKPSGGTLNRLFLEEARYLARLRHPHILSIYGAAVENGRAGLWTELVGGSTIKDLLHMQDELSVEEVREIGRDLCQALSYIHRQGLVHGDVKAENVMRDDNGRIVLMDFGSVRTSNVGDRSIVRASIRYLAPEVLRGADVSATSDIYALGVLLFLLLAGKHPYSDKDIRSLTEIHQINSEPKLSSFRRDLPIALSTSIEKAISIDPSKRHRSASAFATALESQGRPPQTKHWTIASLVATIALATAIALYRMTNPPMWVATASILKSTSGDYQVVQDGGSVQLKDALELQFQSSMPVYLYVIDDDGGGEPAILFPSEDLNLRNPLPQNYVLRLPGMARNGELHDWQVNKDSAADKLIVLATLEVQPALESAISQLRHADAGSALTPGSSLSLRGAYGFVPANRDRSAARSMLDRVLNIEKLSASGKLRYWQFTFPHSDYAGK
jgi:serine/threonine protein kinase